MSEKKVSITVLVPAGRLPLDIMSAAHRLAEQHQLGVYLSTSQNLRLINVPESAVDAVKSELAQLGAEFKGPGKMLLPRVCIGKDHCNLAVIDTEDLNNKILALFADYDHFKGKVKIAVSGCTMCCSNAKLSDIGIMATRNGFEIFAGGKGGPFPKIGRRIERDADEARVLEIVRELMDFHDKKTEKKQRMVKLLDDPEFPFAEV